eukprot:14078205-Ditylum_brightwellii.AAC.1
MEVKATSDMSVISNEGEKVGGDDDYYVDDHFDVNVDGHVDFCIDVAKEDGVDGSVDDGESHLTHLTHEVDCGVKQSVCGMNTTAIRSVLYDSVISNEAKKVDETMLLYDVDDSVDGGDNHLTHLTLFKAMM